MGANSVTTVPVYVSGEVLTAADLNITNSGIPVFADSSARDAAFGGTGEKVLAEGQFAFLEDTNATQFYDGSTWQAVGVAPGLVLVATATASAVASVSIDNCFSSTYACYLVKPNITAATGGTNAGLTFRFRASGVDETTNYKRENLSQYSTNVAGSTGGTSNLNAMLMDATGKEYFSHIEIQNPQAAQQTTGKIISNGATDGNILISAYAGFTQTDSTQFDGITFATTGTNFTGIIRVYGYAN